MSNLFYIWDSKLHAVPQTVEQANEMLEKFMADALALEEAGEEWEVGRSDLLEDYVAELYDYWEQHELDEHNRPQFADGCEGVLIIEEGLMDEGQYYAAVQGAISRGLVFFHVDGGWAFLPDGRILPEEKQEGWEEFAKQQVEEAKKPVEQAFPRTEKEFGKHLYKALDPFIKKHDFTIKAKDYFSILKIMPGAEIESSANLQTYGSDVYVQIKFNIRYIPNMDSYYLDNYMNGRTNILFIKPLYFICAGFKESGGEYLFDSHKLRLERDVFKGLDEVFSRLLECYEKLFYNVQDMEWVNQFLNHNSFSSGIVSAAASLRLILAAVNNDSCFDKVVEEGRNDKIIYFLNDPVNPSPDQAAAEQKYAEYVEYVRNMKTAPWQLEEIPPEYQVKRPEGFLLVHELEVKLKENEIYNTGFTLPVDGVQQYVLKFMTSAEKEQTSFSLKQQEDGVHLTFANWSEVKDYELPEPHLIGKTDEGQDMLMSFRIKANMAFKPKQSLSGIGEASVFNSILTLDITYDLLWQVYIKR